MKYFSGPSQRMTNDTLINQNTVDVKLFCCDDLFWLKFERPAEITLHFSNFFSWFYALSKSETKYEYGNTLGEKK